jgi:hypothetical protein
LVSNYNRDSTPNKYYSNDSMLSHDYYLPQRIGPGALPNYKVIMCKVCSQNGYPHETVVARAKKIVNYNDGSKHIHRQVSDDPDIWAALWSDLK